jgi:tripartite-type tricarboxylate transporter receptor subunit TctC
MAMMLNRREFVGAAAATAASSGAFAQTTDWPNGVIKSVCPFQPGSGADLKARFYADKLAKKLGATVVVENRAGAMGYIATEYVARSKPDGLTIYVSPGSSSFAAAPALFKTLRFDPVNDFEHIALLNFAAFALCVPADKPFKTLADLTPYLKQKGAKGSYASVAPPSVVFGETYKARFGLETVEIKYKEAAPIIGDLINGVIDFTCIDLISVAGFIKSGSLRPLAMACAERMKASPDIPGAAEAGIPDFDLKGWWSVAVPAKTPKPICDRL